MKTNLSIAGAMLLSASMAMTGCETQEQTGQVLGGVAGAAAGSQVGGGSGRTIATIGGAILGAAIGGRVGSNMDERDLRQTGQALESTETGETARWVNPDTGNAFAVRPTSTYQAADGPCREYELDAEIDGEDETITGTACRQADGTWR